MNKRPLFDSTDQAVEVLFDVIRGLIHALAALVTAVVHMAVLLALLTLAWAFQVTPATAAAWASALSGSWLVAVLGTAGLTAAGAYWWAAKRLHALVLSKLLDEALRDTRR